MRILFCFVVALGSVYVPSNLFAGVIVDSAGELRSVAFQNRNSITGFVFGESRRPLSDLYVELQTETYSTIARARTNGTGTFSFNGLASGHYTVRVLTGGTDYESASQSVSLIPVSAIPGRGVASEQVDFHLRLRPSTNRGSGGSAAVIFAQEVPAEAEALYKAGVEDLAKERAADGLEKLKKALEIFPAYYYALDRLGTEYIARGQYQPAAVLLSRAVSVNSRSFSSTLGLGLAEFRLNRLNEAVDRFRGAVRIDKESANANLWLGISLHAKGTHDEALSSLKKANTLSNGTVAEVHWQMARVYKDLTRFADAAAALELYLKFKPDAANADDVRKIIQHLKNKKSA